MKPEFQQYKDESILLYDKVKKINALIDAFKSLEGEDVSSLQKYIIEKDAILARINKIDNLIRAFQQVCPHNFVYEGHDSHKDYYVCSWCDETDSV